MKWLKWIGIVLGGLVVLLLLFINLMAPRFRYADRKIAKTFKKTEIPYKIHRTQYCGAPIRWTEAGKPDAQTLIFFFHGAPGGFGDFKDYMIDSDFADHTLMVSMDRLGYGHSNYGKGEPSIIKHVEAAHFVLEHYEPDTIILVGYSYGGPISGSYAGRYPEKLKSLLMLAPVNHPEAEKIFWFNPVLDTWLAKLLVPRMIEVANVEKMGHAAALEAISADWGKIKVPVTHMHCMDDWIAPYEANTNWSKEHIPADQLKMIEWDGNSHFLPGQVKERIKPVLLELVNK
ncbi:MAG: alpha/beta hydrolase [Bacteroidota bacterium]